MTVVPTRGTSAASRTSLEVDGFFALVVVRFSRSKHLSFRTDQQNTPGSDCLRYTRFAGERRSILISSCLAMVLTLINVSFIAMTRLRSSMAFGSFLAAR
jgi:hypothetical protein